MEPNPDPRFEAYKHLEADHDAIYMKRVQELFFEFFQALSGCVTCFNTVLLNRVIQRRDNAETCTNTHVAVAYTFQSRIQNHSRSSDRKASQGWIVTVHSRKQSNMVDFASELAAIGGEEERKCEDLKVV